MGPATFGWALEQLKAGMTVSREGWNGPGMYLALQVPDTDSKMSLPYIYMSTVEGNLVPWLASQTDMLAEDWQIGRSPGRVDADSEAVEAPSHIERGLSLCEVRERAIRPSCDF